MSPLNLATNVELSELEFVVFDFDGVFTDNTVSVDSNGVESVVCWRGDGLGLTRLKAAGVRAMILSTEKDSVVARRAEKLGVRCRQSVEDKGIAIVELCAELGHSLEKTAFVGNDINDIPGFKLVTMAVAVADAHPATYPYVKYQTATRGGKGAVREVCDLIYKSRALLRDSFL